MSDENTASDRRGRYELHLELQRLNRVAIAARELFRTMPAPTSARVTKPWNALAKALRELEP